MVHLLLDISNSFSHKDQIANEFFNFLDSSWLIDGIIPISYNQVVKSFGWKSSLHKTELSKSKDALSLRELISGFDENDLVVFCDKNDIFVNEECLSGLLFCARAKGCSICGYRLNSTVLLSKNEYENQLIDGKLYSVSTPMAFRVTCLRKILDYKKGFNTCRGLIEAITELGMNMMIYDDHQIENHFPQNSTHDIKMAETLYTSDEKKKMWAAIEEEVMLRHE